MSSYAVEVVYKDTRLKAMPITVQQKVENVLDGFQFKRAFVGTRGSKKLGYNMIFTDAFFTSKIVFKFNVEGNFEMDKFYRVRRGQVYHLKLGGVSSAIYFENLAVSEKKQIIHKLKQIKISKAKISFIQSAYATCLAKDFETNVNLETGVGSSSVSSMLTSCLSEIGAGAEDATIGTLESIGNGIADEWTTFWNNPSKRLGEYWDFTTEGLSKVWDFVKVLGEMFYNPSYAKKVLAEKFGQIGTFFTNIYNNIKSMPLSSKVDMICNILGSIGVDVLITVITVGSGGAKLALTVSKLLLKLTKISKMISKGLVLSFKTLDKISDHLFEKIQSIIKQGNLDLFNKKMKAVNCAF